MTLEPDQLRKLVRRDLIVAGAGSVLAIWAMSLLVAARLHFLADLTAYRFVTGVSVVIAAGCIYRWAAGPRSMLRDRYFVLVPVFLLAGPALYAVHGLGGGLVVTMLSSALGFFAAVVLGFAVGSRRRSAH